MTPWTVALQAPLFMGFSRPEYWSRLPFLSVDNLSDPGIKPVSPAWQANSLVFSQLGSLSTHTDTHTHQFSSVQSLSRVGVFATSCTKACQASLSITNSRTLLKLMSIEMVMSSNHLILCRPLLLLPSTFPSMRVFSNESALQIRSKYWSFRFSISPSNEYSGLNSFRMDWLDLLAVQGTLTSLLQHQSSKASILCTQLSL